MRVVERRKHVSEEDASSYEWVRRTITLAEMKRAMRRRRVVTIVDSRSRQRRSVNSHPINNDCDRESIIVPTAADVLT